MGVTLHTPFTPCTPFTPSTPLTAFAPSLHPLLIGRVPAAVVLRFPYGHGRNGQVPRRKLFVYPAGNVLLRRRERKHVVQVNVVRQELVQNVLELRQVPY